MKKTQMIATVLSLSSMSYALACSPDGSEGLIPKNKIYIPIRAKESRRGLTEAQFNNAIWKVESTYAPILANAGVKVKFDKRWNYNQVNASVKMWGDDHWHIDIMGGLARHETMTEDGLSLAVCHEIGHLIGGAPTNESNTVTNYVHVESQADYFATLKCLRKTFLHDNNATIIKEMTVPAMVTEQCEKSMQGNIEDTALCVRTSMAGKSLSNLFSALKDLPETKFDTPDMDVVNRTTFYYPKPQCRLDTFFQGSLCNVSMNEDVSMTDEVKGTCHPSLGHKTGLRPLCWFRPSK